MERTKEESDMLFDKVFTLLKMPQEFDDLFKNEYERLKKQANTYDELKGMISLEVQNAKFYDAPWGTLLEKKLRNQMHREIGSLPIR